MKWLGYSRLKIASLRMDVADIRRRGKAKHVAELAENIREHGEEPIQAPTVRKRDKRLICGRDRIAACLSLKLSHVWVHLVDCDDQKAEELELSENLFRRHNDDRSDQIARLAQLREAYYLSTRPDASTQQVRTLANADVAKAANVTVQSVKNAKARAAAAEDSAAGTPPPSSLQREPAASAAEAGTTSPPAIDLLGVDDACARYAADTARADQEAIDRADQLLRQAQAELRKLTACTAHQNLHQQVHRVASLVRAARPAAICPWCKALPREVAGFVCAPCSGLGYVPDEVRDWAPTELVKGAPMVAVDGRFVAYEAAKNRKAG